MHKPIRPLRQDRPLLTLVPRQQSAPRGDSCPTCHIPFSETGHGWLRDYSDHSMHSGPCLPRYGYCLRSCPICSGDAIARKQAREQAALVSSLFGGAHLPFQARDWTFATFPEDGDQDAKHAVQLFVMRHLTGDEEHQRGLYLGGAAGRCKTGLAICALKAVMEAGHSGLFVMTLELMNRLRASFAKGAGVREDELLEAVTEVEWLVLDDLAVERPTPYVLEQLYFIIEKRRSQGLYTIFTSNLSTTNLEAHWRPESVQPGAFHSGVRIAERLREYCLGCTVKGRNMRGI